MSTEMFYESKNRFYASNVLRGKHFVVSTKQNKLGDFVREVIDTKKLSYRRVAARSQGKISAPRISEIIAGNYDKIQIETLVGLANGLGVSEEKIVALYRGEPTGKIDESIAVEFNYLAFGYDNAKKRKSKRLKNIEALKELLRREIEEAQEE